MPILNGLSKKLSEVAQTTVQVSKELAGSAKATLAISAEEREIEKAYEVFENREDGVIKVAIQMEE